MPGQRSTRCRCWRRCVSEVYHGQSSRTGEFYSLLIIFNVLLFLCFFSFFWFLCFVHFHYSIFPFFCFTISLFLPFLHLCLFSHFPYCSRFCFFMLSPLSPFSHLLFPFICLFCVPFPFSFSFFCVPDFFSIFSDILCFCFLSMLFYHFRRASYVVINGALAISNQIAYATRLLL